MKKAYWVVYEDGEMWIDAAHKRGSDLMFQWVEDAIREAMGPDVKTATGYVEVMDDKTFIFIPESKWIVW